MMMRGGGEGARGGGGWTVELRVRRRREREEEVVEWREVREGEMVGSVNLERLREEDEEKDEEMDERLGTGGGMEVGRRDEEDEGWGSERGMEGMSRGWG